MGKIYRSIFDISDLASTDYNRLINSMKNGRLMRSVVIFLLLSSCSFFATPDKSTSAKNTYTISKLPSSWKEVKTQDHDYVFYGPNGSSLMIQSFCNEFQSASLSNLAHTTFKSLDRSKIIEQKEFMLQDRAALMSKGEATIDGVRFRLTLVNTKRNNCYYDFLEVLPQQGTDSITDQLIKELTFK